LYAIDEEKCEATSVKWDGKVKIPCVPGVPDVPPGHLVICAKGPVEIFRFNPDGEVLYRGRPILNDKELVDGLREVFEGNQHIHKYNELERWVRSLMAYWSELDDAEDDAEVVVAASTMKELRRLLEL